MCVCGVLLRLRGLIPSPRLKLAAPPSPSTLSSQSNVLCNGTFDCTPNAKYSTSPGEYHPASHHVADPLDFVTKVRARARRNASTCAGYDAIRSVLICPPFAEPNRANQAPASQMGAFGVEYARVFLEVPSLSKRGIFLMKNRFCIIT